MHPSFPPTKLAKNHVSLIAFVALARNRLSLDSRLCQFADCSRALADNSASARNAVVLLSSSASAKARTFSPPLLPLHINARTFSIAHSAPRLRLAEHARSTRVNVFGSSRMRTASAGRFVRNCGMPSKRTASALNDASSPPLVNGANADGASARATTARCSNPSASNTTVNASHTAPCTRAAKFSSASHNPHANFTAHATSAGKRALASSSLAVANAFVASASSVPASYPIRNPSTHFSASAYARNARSSPISLKLPLLRKIAIATSKNATVAFAFAFAFASLAILSITASNASISRRVASRRATCLRRAR